MERSFAEDVKQLGYGAGQILHGEGILAITKALLESGVSYVGGYPGAPVSHLIDVLADANEPLLKPMGVYFEQSGSEAAAAALLGASINYPMRGAVTWKSVVGTNVASDALSHVASAGVLGGALIVIGEDYGEGASILQERTHSAALKSSVPLLDPRTTLPSFQRFVQEGFGLSEACHEPVFFSIRIRACHLRGTMVCRDNVKPADQHALAARPRPASLSSASTCRPSPTRWRRGSSRSDCRRRGATWSSTGSTSISRGRRARSASSCRVACGAPPCAGWRALGLADIHGRTPIPLLILNCLHPLVPEELLGFLRGKRRVLVVEEGMPNYIERELKALAHEARLDVEISGKDVLSPAGEYVPGLVIGGLRRFLTAAPLRSVSDDGHRGALPGADRPPGEGPRGAPAAGGQAAALLLHGLSGAAGVQRHEDPQAAGAGHRRYARRPRHRLQHVLHAGALQRRQLGPRLRDGPRVVQRGGAALRQAGRLGDGRRRLLAQRAHQRRGQRRPQQAGLGAGHPRQLLRGGHGPAPPALDGDQRAAGAGAP